MRFSSYIVASVISSLATATPFPSPADPPPPGKQYCSPRFDGREMQVNSMANFPLSWGIRERFQNHEYLYATADEALRLEMFFQQTGFPEVTYTIKSKKGSNLIVGVNGGSLFLTTDDEAARQKHRWIIECAGQCRPVWSTALGDIVDDRCRIRYVPDGKCVQFGQDPDVKPGAAIFLGDCESPFASLKQKFHFLPYPSNVGGTTGPSGSSTAPGSSGGAEGSSTSSGAADASGGPDGAVTGSFKAHLAADGQEGSGISAGDIKKLITNSYIAIGLLAAVLIALMVLFASVSLKGKSGRKYTQVSKIDSEAFIPPKSY